MLGMLVQAAEELAVLTTAELAESESIELLLDLEMERKNWPEAIDLAHEYSQRRPKEEKGWICWAYALREAQRIPEARSVLLDAESLHGKKCGLLHFNLACYYCLLGELPEARRRLARAVSLQPSFAVEAKEDPDLKPLFD